MDQGTRRIIGFGAYGGDVDGVALCCMFNKAIARMGVPKYLSSDNDPLFTYYRWEANLRINTPQTISCMADERQP